MTGTQEHTGRRPWVAPVALLPAGVVLGLLVLVWAATTGPVDLMHDSGRRFVFTPPDPATVTPSYDDPAPNLREVTRDVKPAADLAWVGNLLAVAALLGVCVALLLAARWLWRRRWHPPEPLEEVAFEVLPDRVVAALQQDADARVDAVARGTPRNGIVACWLRLQETLDAAGLRSDRSETAAEYVVRVLKQLDLDPRAIGELAALYREARFSEHELGETERERAQAALATLHRDLDARRTTA